MPTPGEHKTVQARILTYAQEIGWTYMPREEAERRRGFAPHPNPFPEDGAREIAERAHKASSFFGDLLHAQVRAFNPKYKEAEGALVGEFDRFYSDRPNSKPLRHLRATLYGAIPVSRQNKICMPKLVSQQELELVLSAVARFPEGGSVEDIGGALDSKLPRRTLQRRLALSLSAERGLS